MERRTLATRSSFRPPLCCSSDDGEKCNREQEVGGGGGRAWDYCTVLKIGNKDTQQFKDEAENEPVSSTQASKEDATEKRASVVISVR